MNPTRFRRLTAAVVAVCAALVTVGAVPAHAHEGEGVLALESALDAAGLSVPYVVRLTWGNDRDPAVDATVTATPIDPSGTPQTPVPLEQQDDDGRYAGTITFPASGSWTVRFTSVTPAATLEVVQEVSGPPLSTATSTTSSTTSTTEPPAGAGSSDDDRASRADKSEDDDSGIAGLLAAALLAVIVGGAVFGAARARRSRSMR